METCTINVSAETYAKLRKVSYVVIAGYKTYDGRRFGDLVYFGTLEECTDAATRPGMLVVPNGITYLAHQVIAVSDILPLPASEGEGLITADKGR